MLEPEFCAAHTADSIIHAAHTCMHGAHRRCIDNEGRSCLGIAAETRSDFSPGGRSLIGVVLDGVGRWGKKLAIGCRGAYADIILDSGHIERMLKLCGVGRCRRQQPSSTAKVLQFLSCSQMMYVLLYILYMLYHNYIYVVRYMLYVICYTDDMLGIKFDITLMSSCDVG